MNVEKEYGADVEGAVQCETSFRVSVRAAEREFQPLVIHLQFDSSTRQHHLSQAFSTQQITVVLPEGDFMLNITNASLIRFATDLGVDIWRSDK
jgi:hypothetical protein